MPELSVLDYLFIFLGSISGGLGVVYTLVFFISRLHPRARSAPMGGLPFGVALILLAVYLFGLVF